MTLSQSPLQFAAHAFATIFVGFGINAILRSDQALTFFQFEPPIGAADHKMVNSLMAVYGVRDIFMGLAIYAAGYFGTRQALGWTLIAASAVAFADGAVCWTHGAGQWNHWACAPVIAVVGSLILGMFDRS
jgi:Domain of unknown function (DUF4267)